MKRLIVLLITTLLVFTMGGCGNSDKYTYVEIDGGYKIWASSNYEGVLTIPESYNDLPILEIEFFSSHYSRNVTKIVGSKNLEKINSWTFAGRDQKSMNNLTEVVFSYDANLKSIDTMAFYWQTNLKTVVLPQEFEYFGDGVFERCFNLENLVIHSIIPPQIDGDIFNSDSTLINNEYWHTKPNQKFTVYVPNEAVETYKQSEWNKYTIKPISEAEFTN